MTYQQHLETITRIGREYRYCKSIESLFELDQWTLLPARGVDYRQETAAFVARRKDELYLTGEAAAEEAYFEKVSLDKIEDPVERGVVRTFLQRRRVAAPHAGGPAAAVQPGEDPLHAEVEGSPGGEGLRHLHALAPAGLRPEGADRPGHQPRRPGPSTRWSASPTQGPTWGRSPASSPCCRRAWAPC